MDAGPDGRTQPLAVAARNACEQEGNVLFNDALNTFSYGYMASDIW